MKRSRDEKEHPDTSSSRTGGKKSKSFQACTSCRKHKTRCEILDPSKSPVRCHRCQVLALQCSYEETMVPTPSTSKLPTTPTPSETGAQTSTAQRPAVPLGPMPATDRLWSFVSDQQTGIDWSAPMLAIQQLSKLPFAHIPPPAEPVPVLADADLSLSRILTEDRIRYLLDLYVFPLPPPLPDTNVYISLLDGVCCAIASRHLDSVSGGVQRKMQLQKLAENSIAKMIFNPRPSESVEAIQALLVLSLWAPLGGPPENEGRDGRLLIASALSMAMNLRLNQASAKAEALRERNNGRLSREDADALEGMLENARLWVALTNTESMLCLGTGRVPLSRRSAEDITLIEFPRSFVELEDYRDMRLGLIASAFGLVEEAVSSRLLPGTDVDTWYDGIMVVLEKMKRGKRLLTPLPVVLEHENFYFHILHIYDCMARLLVLYHALWDARVSVGSIPPGEIWHTHFQPHGVDAVGEWGRDMIQTAEALLVYVLEADARLLSTAPDNAFTMVALAAGYVVGVKFLMLRIRGAHLYGASDLLLGKTVAHLSGVACAPGHAAQRAAFLVQGMIARWESRTRQEQGQAAEQTHAEAPGQAEPPAQAQGSAYPTPSSDQHELPAFTDLGFPGPAPVEGELDFSMFMNSTITLDAEFWNNLAQTQLFVGYQ
ncbi:hypothetical protein B0H10DRAFT_2212915 [Mycena sp. CBHHK59/15]|nr:hypothetical protein B0H10DRAFT_2212915 [Mycena sp. CBHHK59/15]